MPNINLNLSEEQLFKATKIATMLSLNWLQADCNSCSQLKRQLLLSRSKSKCEVGLRKSNKKRSSNDRL